MLTHVRRFLTQRPTAPYVLTLLGVLAAFPVRVALEPMLRGNNAYSVFYPVVLFAAYRAGRGPAIVGAVASAALGFFAFVAPRFGQGSLGGHFAPLVMFAATSTVGIYLVSGLTESLHRISASERKLDELAETHAALFRELQARISQHMRLIAGVLALQARDEPDEQVRKALRIAGERSELIGRTNRRLSGQPDAAIDFVTFATALMRATLAQHAQPVDKVRVASASVLLDVDQSISLGVALAEGLTGVLAHKPQGPILVEFAQDEGWTTATVTLQPGPDGDSMSAPSDYLFQAMVEQLGAEVQFVDLPGPRLRFDMRVPRHAPLPTRASLSPHLH